MDVDRIPGAMQLPMGEVCFARGGGGRADGLLQEPLLEPYLKQEKMPMAKSRAAKDVE